MSALPDISRMVLFIFVVYAVTCCFAKNSFAQAVVIDFGRSSGMPMARDQHNAASTPNVRDTPNKTV